MITSTIESIHDRKSPPPPPPPPLNRPARYMLLLQSMFASLVTQQIPWLCKPSGTDLANERPTSCVRAQVLVQSRLVMERLVTCVTGVPLVGLVSPLVTHQGLGGLKGLLTDGTCVLLPAVMVPDVSVKGTLVGVGATTQSAGLTGFPTPPWVRRLCLCPVWRFQRARRGICRTQIIWALRSCVSMFGGQALLVYHVEMGLQRTGRQSRLRQQGVIELSHQSVEFFTSQHWRWGGLLVRICWCKDVGMGQGCSLWPLRRGWVHISSRGVRQGRQTADIWCTVTLDLRRQDPGAGWWRGGSRGKRDPGRTDRSWNKQNPMLGYITTV